MPHNLANIQPLLTASRLSLLKGGEKGKTHRKTWRKRKNPQNGAQDCSWLFQHPRPRADGGDTRSWWLIHDLLCCSAAGGRHSPVCASCVHPRVFHLCKHLFK